MLVFLIEPIIAYIMYAHKQIYYTLLFPHLVPEAAGILKLVHLVLELDVPQYNSEHIC